MHQDEYDGVPSCLKRGTVLGAVKAWPGNVDARGETSATASLNGPCARRPDLNRRPGRRNGLMARTKELHR